MAYLGETLTAALIDVFTSKGLSINDATAKARANIVSAMMLYNNSLVAHHERQTVKRAVSVVKAWAATLP